MCFTTRDFSATQTFAAWRGHPSHALSGSSVGRKLRQPVPNGPGSYTRDKEQHCVLPTAGAPNSVSRCFRVVSSTNYFCGFWLAKRVANGPIRAYPNERWVDPLKMAIQKGCSIRSEECKLTGRPIDLARQRRSWVFAVACASPTPPIPDEYHWPLVFRLLAMLYEARHAFRSSEFLERYVKKTVKHSLESRQCWHIQQ